MGPGGGDDSDTGTLPGGADGSDPSAGGDGTASGELPFTGYPMTPLLLLLLALLAAGLLLRAYLAVRTRLQARGDLAAP